MRIRGKRFPYAPGKNGTSLHLAMERSGGENRRAVPAHPFKGLLRKARGRRSRRPTLIGARSDSTGLGGRHPSTPAPCAARDSSEDKRTRAGNGAHGRRARRRNNGGETSP